MATSFDIIFEKALVFDGTGRPPEVKDVGVSKAEIARRLRVGRTSVRRILKEGGPKC